MGKLASIVERFPTEELAIRRLCNVDADFKGVCEDYDEAAGAMQLWDAAGAPALAEEYSRIMVDLEAEILEALAADKLRHTHRTDD